MRATLHTDGAARHKQSEPTGPAGIGAVLRSESGQVIGEIASVRQQLHLFSTSSLTRVDRALNADADKLANQGIDDAISRIHGS